MSREFKLLDVLATSQAVFEDQGFIKSGHSVWNFIPDSAEMKLTYDNKTVVTSHLIYEVDSYDGMNHLNVTEEHYIKAKEILAYFKQELTMQKLGDTLNEFSATLFKIINNDYVGGNYDIAVLASLPNSYIVKDQRQKMIDFYEANKTIGSYVGNLKDRFVVDANVVDVKWIKSAGVYLVIGLTAKNQIVKFFMSGDETNDLNNTTIKFLGTVRSQEINSYSECYETMFNRCKIQ